MTKLITTASIAAMLIGCAPVPWHKAGVTEQRQKKDLAECEYEAAKATAAVINSFNAGWEKATLQRQCMEVRGYSQKKSP